MPLYTFVTTALATADRDRVVELAATRFPEVAVEPNQADVDGSDRITWVCEAPNESHLQRWARAAALELIQVRDISHSKPPTVDRPRPHTTTHTTTEKEDRCTHMTS